MLIGKVTKEEIFKNSIPATRFFEHYTPQERSLRMLGQYPKEVHIEIFYASWCPDALEHVPAFFKILDLLNHKGFTSEVTALDRDKSDHSGKAKQYGITKTPTFIFFVEQKEIGLIIETPDKTLEEDLCRILGVEEES